MHPCSKSPLAFLVISFSLYFILHFEPLQTFRKQVDSQDQSFTSLCKCKPHFSFSKKTDKTKSIFKQMKLFFPFNQKMFKLSLLNKLDVQLVIQVNRKKIAFVDDVVIDVVAILASIVTIRVGVNCSKFNCSTKSKIGRFFICRTCKGNLT